MPGGLTGLSVIGQTDIDGNGVSGLELQFGDGDETAEADDLLMGRPGLISREVAPGGRSIAGTETVTREPVPGVDLVTTIDRSVQFAVEQELVRYVGQMEALGGQVVIMGTNGDVYAMVSVTRDERGVAVVDRGNWTAVGSYEPGSVGKVITMAGALEDGVVTLEQAFYVEDNYDCTNDPTDQPLRDSHPHPPMMMSAADILVESSNVGTILVSRELGRGDRAAGLERLYHYMTSFGLGTRTSLDFPGESAGILETWDQWEGTERCTMAYGTGFAATPIQLAAAVNVIANDGVYAGPRLVSATVGADGDVTPMPATPTHQVVSQATAETMQQMMREVVCSPDGTANAAQVPGLSVAGKTGTAYKTQADGTYFNAEGTRNYYLSFVGFFPAEDPQVTILVSIDDPPKGTSGGQAAAPLFATLAPTIVSELGIQPPPGSTGCDGN
jgi:cell division protein FtsI (penicillin-binding protein 3)